MHDSGIWTFVVTLSWKMLSLRGPERRDRIDKKKEGKEIERQEK